MASRKGLAVAVPDAGHPGGGRIDSKVRPANHPTLVEGTAREHIAASPHKAASPLRVLVVQETDWIDRNPILHHRMLESLSISGDDITVLDYEIRWGQSGTLPLWQRRRVWRDVSKVLAGSRITVIRPAMLRVPGLARLSWLLATWRELRRYIQVDRPDVIVAYGITNSLLVRILSRRSRIPLVFHLFDSLNALAEPATLRPLAALVERVVLQTSDRVVIAHRALGGYVAGMGVRPDRVTLIPNGMTQRLPDQARRAAMRSKLGLADDEVALLFVGWLYRHSGLVELSLEFARHLGSYARFKIVIVGDGDLSSTLADIKAEKGLGNRLILTGRRPIGEIPDFIAASDVCLLPAMPSDAMRYVVPSKVDEYLELGKPVASTRSEGMLAELSDVPGIIWVDSAADVLPRLHQLLSGPNEPADVLAGLSRACARYAASREDWDTVTSRFRSVLTAAASRSSA